MDRREVPPVCLARSKKNRANVYPRRDQLRLLKALNEEKFGDGTRLLSEIFFITQPVDS